MARTIVTRVRKHSHLRPRLRIVPARANPGITRDFVMRALLYWFFGGIGIGIAVLILAQGAGAETIKLPGANGVLTPVPVVSIKGAQAGDYVDAREVARILRGTYQYNPATRIFVIDAQGRKTSFLVGSERFLIRKTGVAPVAGRVTKPPIRNRGRTLMPRTSASSFLKQFNKAAMKTIPSNLLENLPIPIKPDTRATSPVPAPSTNATPVTTPVAIVPGNARVAPFIRNIVIDAGHGDQDAGAVGPGGTKEKDVNLDVAVKLADFLSARTAGKVTLTRKDDTFLSLKERVDRAKGVHADLFISVHTNSSGGRNRRLATGSEVYFFSSPSDEDARRAEKLEGGPFDPKAEGIDPVLWDLMLAGNVVESHKLAEAVSARLPKAVGLPNRGVRSARFYVMYYGVMSNIPSILVELGFVSNPDEEQKLADPEWRTKAAEAIAGATVEYLKDLERRYPGGKGWVR